jgi:hypothetical protein
MSTHDQQQIVLDQMTYECIAVIPAGKNWLDRLLQVLQHVLFLRRYGGDDAQGMWRMSTRWSCLANIE